VVISQKLTGVVQNTGDAEKDFAQLTMYVKLIPGLKTLSLLISMLFQDALLQRKKNAVNCR